MFLRQTRRKKDGKTHSYWSVVENHRLGTGRVVQRHGLYLGEISPSQAAAWRKSIEVFDQDAGHSRTLALFPEDRATAAVSDTSVVHLRLSAMRLFRPRQWGACWLAGQLWSELQLDRFWADRLPTNRKGTRWDQVLQVLVSYRLITPGSEWKLHRDWFGRTAMADLLGSDFRLAEPHKLYACHDFLLRWIADIEILQKGAQKPGSRWPISIRSRSNRWPRPRRISCGNRRPLPDPNRAETLAICQRCWRPCTRSSRWEIASC